MLKKTFQCRGHCLISLFLIFFLIRISIKTFRYFLYLFRWGFAIHSLFTCFEYVDVMEFGQFCHIFLSIYGYYSKQKIVLLYMSLQYWLRMGTLLFLWQIFHSKQMNSNMYVVLFTTIETSKQKLFCLPTFQMFTERCVNIP